MDPLYFTEIKRIAEKFNIKYPLDMNEMSDFIIDHYDETQYLLQIQTDTT